MKTALLSLLVGTSSLGAGEKPMSLQEAAAELRKGTLNGANASSSQYAAFRELVRLGPDGWKRLFDIQFQLGADGDAARRIDSFWEYSGIPQDHMERFWAAQRAELTRRSANETWALLYAGAYGRTSFPPRRPEEEQEKLDRQFSRIEKSVGKPEEALIGVAFLRIQLVEVSNFPGHRFPWSEKPEKQKAALQGLLEWWKKHRADFNPDDE